MFTYYQRLCAAKHNSVALLREWTELVERMALPEERELSALDRLEGHIPYHASLHVWDRAPRLFACRGLYVWGAWTGTEARIQYIGIADRQTIRERFAGKSGNGRYRDELDSARRYCKQYRELPEAFTYTNRLPSERYTAKGIKVKKKKETRPPRSERYAKVGLENLWHFLIPAPGQPIRRKRGESGFKTDRVLCELEAALIQLTSARLHRGFDREPREPLCFPLLNRKEVMPNAFVPASSPDYQGFFKWLTEGPWWSEMDRYVADAHRGEE